MLRYWPVTFYWLETLKIRDDRSSSLQRTLVARSADTKQQSDKHEINDTIFKKSRITWLNFCSCQWYIGYPRNSSNSTSSEWWVWQSSRYCSGSLLSFRSPSSGISFFLELLYAWNIIVSSRVLRFKRAFLTKARLFVNEVECFSADRVSISA